MSTDDPATLVPVLHNIDVIISAVGPEDQLVQLNLIAAGALAGHVKRFVPCAFTTIAPPGGIMLIRDVKEEVYGAIFRAKLPYTIIDT